MPRTLYLDHTLGILLDSGIEAIYALPEPYFSTPSSEVYTLWVGDAAAYVVDLSVISTRATLAFAKIARPLPLAEFVVRAGYGFAPGIYWMRVKRSSAQQPDAARYDTLWQTLGAPLPLPTRHRRR